MDGEMVFSTAQREDYRGEAGERGLVTRHPDNLRLEGSMDGVRSMEYTATKGDRATITRHQDNLRFVCFVVVVSVELFPEFFKI